MSGPFGSRRHYGRFCERVYDAIVESDAPPTGQELLARLSARPGCTPARLRYALEDLLQQRRIRCVVTRRGVVRGGMPVEYLRYGFVDASDCGPGFNPEEIDR